VVVAAPVAAVVVAAPVAVAVAAPAGEPRRTENQWPFRDGAACYLVADPGIPRGL